MTTERCNEWHQFDDEPLGVRHQCERDAGDGHGETALEPHWDERGRWWCRYTQSRPVPNSEPAIVDLVMADLKERDLVGQRRYGTRLPAHNGRDALLDAYQKALDLAIYLRQAIEERVP